MQPYWRNILKNKKIFTGCGQNRITEKEEKKETVESEMNAEVKKQRKLFGLFI